jgi:ketosteroid isomerase-like protein
MSSNGSYGEIVSAIARIMRAVDHHDREGFGDGWSQDVEFEVVFFGQAPLRLRGRDEMVARFTANWDSEASELRHQIGAVEVDIRGEDLASARFYCVYVRTGAAATLAGMGEYEDDLVREADGRWRVARRRHVFLTPLAH